MDRITLKTLPQATAQQVFDQVAVHLLTQNAKSQVINAGDPRCVYRGPNGALCAAGSLIADDEYHNDFEGVGWSFLRWGGRVPEAHSNLIIMLQRIHDALPVEDWREALEDLAARHGLNTFAIDSGMEVIPCT